LRCQFDKWTLVCQVAAKLHNFCIEEGEESLSQRHEDDVEEGDSPVVLMNMHVTDEPRRVRATGRRREELTDRLEEEGVRRPNTSDFSRE